MRVLSAFALGFAAANAATFKNFPNTVTCVQEDGSFASRTAAELKQIVLDTEPWPYSDSASDVASGKCMGFRNIPYILAIDPWGTVGYAHDKAADIYYFCHGLGAPSIETGGYQPLCEES